ncbi:hypothetical protein Mal4_17440 [Maioricimonas rarisocia]|uniref:Secreted protein n=1 Tax=Maioricimonas rarisocia TaxID=2528026 RepID=A0A517Z4L9_9PLAN|nr:hypothetical protein [Maioricimonas rarisocia]QDU37432.1 hypothetical protein Mal4_17440 [Maioricimonas rarisocia]
MTRVTLQRLVAAVVPALLVAGAAGGASADETGVVRLNDTGVVRISDDESSENVVRGQSPEDGGEIQQASCQNCQSGHYGGDVIYSDGPYYGDCYECGSGGSHSFLSDNFIADWLHNQAAAHRARNLENSARMRWKFTEACYHNRAWARCKLGYFIPTGCCGKGCPPVGLYSAVYPVNPHHFDGRDGQVYAAQGVGGPVSVPLAPNVRHTYNYGWGVPSSRLTPISHPLPPVQ